MAKIRLALDVPRSDLEGALRFDVAKDTLYLSIRARPGSRRERLSVGPSGELVLDVAAPPVDGKANARILRLIAHLFDVRPGICRIVRGASARTKQIAVAALPLAEALARADRLRG